jgi:predicted dehydrogenase
VHDEQVLRVAVVGIGKMGLSHLSLVGAHPRVRVVAVCDSSRLVPDVLAKYTGVVVYKDFDQMTREVDLDAVVVATPSSSHHTIVSAALGKGYDVFCEKPLTLTAQESTQLAVQAAGAGVHAQVGYHNRFVASFAEAKRLLDAGALGRVTHVRAEAQGPVVLKSTGGTWRSDRSQGGSCLYDYAAHPIDLLNWYLGEPQAVSGTVLGHVFSERTEDEVYATLHYAEDVSAQLSVSWSDESQRKMTTRLNVWGTGGRITVDRQECQVYLRDTQPAPPGYRQGWNVKYTTELTEAPWFYVRGEEYSAEIDHFVTAALARRSGKPVESQGCSFGTGALTDEVIDMMLRDAQDPRRTARRSGDGTTSPPTVVPERVRARRLQRAVAIARRIVKR